MPRTCTTCLGDLTGHRADARFCSDRCRAAHTRAVLTGERELLVDVLARQTAAIAAGAPLEVLGGLAQEARAALARTA
jgi:hypothetical protein